MKGKSCFFIGHRDAPDRLFSQILEAVEKHIVEYGVTDFYVGHYGNFDRLAKKAVIYAKRYYKDIRLILLLPYHPYKSKIEISNDFDSSYYPEGMENVPQKFAIVRANRYMVDKVDYLIAYAVYSASNTMDLVDYAMKKTCEGRKVVTNIK